MKRHVRYPLYFIAPAFAVYFALFVFPALSGFAYSFTDWSAYSEETKWIGLDNYRQLFSEGVLGLAIKNTLLYALVVTIFVNLFGLILALLLNRNSRLGKFYRTSFYTPVVIAPLIVGYLFTAIYNPEQGILNEALRFFGLGRFAVDWLNDSRYALFSIMLTELWRSSGFAMVIYLAGLKTIPQDLLEQASVDGAGAFRKFRNVTFPLLAPSFTVNLLLTVINSLKVFETVLVLTNGGPGYDTEVFNTLIFRNFSRGNWGYATASGLVLTIIVSVIAVTFLRILRKREVEL
ncbi:carbohydrate ABC transporter permease [Cohnella thailandensis]|uniref:Sugar ABC transporter permease n=1 Tax=Cohnella thailandensis TaxID=557557 RepID=A0A841SUS2_9BACL|nr:sugar ABC transporter permease [Cohnella thailandensis]MBB6636063.1 sugar ABC transporter permease [Cohnella thailandensis]MBP1976782.1 ABC-type sugar transport system permease subunit [Cohnella thailandensis]